MRANNINIPEELLGKGIQILIVHNLEGMSCGDYQKLHEEGRLSSLTRDCSL